ncbi:hypothetical protein COOONC_24390 [Cooperia oncophora]
MFTFGILLLSLCGLCVGYRQTFDTQSCGADHGEFMDDTTRHKLLQYHEGTRFTLALGESPNSEGYYHLPAKNLFKMRWNCDLEKEARNLTKNCPDTVSGVQKTEDISHKRNVTGTKQGKYNFLSDAVDAWLFLSDVLPMGPNATFNDTELYPFANSGLRQGISNVGCHIRTVYTAEAQSKPRSLYLQHQRSLGVQLYEIGSWNQTIAGCAWNNTVCEFIKLPEPEKSNVKIFSANYLTRFRTDSYDFQV